MHLYRFIHLVPAPSYRDSSSELHSFSVCCASQGWCASDAINCLRIDTFKCVIPQAESTVTLRRDMSTIVVLFLLEKLSQLLDKGLLACDHNLDHTV